MKTSLWIKYFIVLLLAVWSVVTTYVVVKPMYNTFLSAQIFSGNTVPQGKGIAFSVFKQGATEQVVYQNNQSVLEFSNVTSFSREEDLPLAFSFKGFLYVPSTGKYDLQVQYSGSYQLEFGQTTFSQQTSSKVFSVDVNTPGFIPLIVTGEITSLNDSFSFKWKPPSKSFSPPAKQEMFAFIPECFDGIDNNSDSFSDYPNDPNCKSLDDFFEQEVPSTLGETLAFFSFEGNYTDTTQNKISLQPQTGTGFISSGRYGQAVQFSTPESFLELPSTKELNLKTPHTISFWFQFLNESNEQVFLLSEEKTGKQFWKLAYQGKKIIVQNDKTVISFYEDIPLKNWQHLSVVSTGQTVQLFLNGIKRAEGQIITNIDFTAPLFLGGGKNHGFLGLIDSLMVSQKAFNQEEVLEVFEFDLQGGESVFQQLSTPALLSTKDTSSTSNPATNTININNKTIVQVKGNQIGQEACRQIAPAKTTAYCFSQESDSAQACLHFNPGASVFNESQISSERLKALVSPKGAVFCSQEDSKTCWSSDTNTPLQNTCRVCENCSQNSCDYSPKNLGVNELFVECLFSHDEQCSEAPVTTSVQLKKTTTKRTFYQMSFPYAFPAHKFDLIDLITTNPGQLIPLEQGKTQEPLPTDKNKIKKVFVTEIGSTQPNHTTYQLFDGSHLVYERSTSVYSDDDAQNSGYNIQKIQQPIPAEFLYLPPNNGFYLWFYLEEETEESTVLDIQTDNKKQIQPLGGLSSFFPQTPLPSEDNVSIVATIYHIENMSPDILTWVEPSQISQTSLKNSLSSDGQDIIFSCKDADKNGVCDFTECTLPPTSLSSTQVPVKEIPIVFSETPKVVTVDLLPNQEVNLKNTCSSCVLKPLSSPVLVEGIGAHDEGKKLVVQLTNTQTGKSSYTVLLFGKTQQATVADYNKQVFNSQRPLVILKEKQVNAFFTDTEQTSSSRLVNANFIVLEKTPFDKALFNKKQFAFLWGVSPETKTLFFDLQEVFVWELEEALNSQLSGEFLRGVLQNAQQQGSCSQALASLDQQSLEVQTWEGFELLLQQLSFCRLKLSL